MGVTLANHFLTQGFFCCGGGVRGQQADETLVVHGLKKKTWWRRWRSR